MRRTGGPLIHTLEGHTDVVNTVAVLDATRVISASDDETLRAWDVESGKTLRAFEGHTSVVAVLNASRVVSASDDHTLRVWDVESGKILCTLEGHTSVVAVLDASRVVSASFAETLLRVWDVESGKTLSTLEGHADEVNAVAVLDASRGGIVKCCGSTFFGLRLRSSPPGWFLALLGFHSQTSPLRVRGVEARHH